MHQEARGVAIGLQTVSETMKIAGLTDELGVSLRTGQHLGTLSREARRHIDMPWRAGNIVFDIYFFSYCSIKTDFN